MSSFHSTYRFIYPLVPKDVEIIDLDLIGNSNAKSILAYFLAFLNYVYIILRLLTSKNKKFLFREYNNYALPILNTLVRLRKIKIWLIVNHNFYDQVSYEMNLIKYRDLRIEFLVFEYSKPGCDPVLFFPMNKLEFKTLAFSSEYIVVSIIGSYRKEKNIESTLDFIEQNYNVLSKKYIFFLGCDLDIRTGSQRNIIKYINTNNHSEFQKLINLTNIALFNYSSSYEFRTSGVLFDVISKGVFPIVKSNIILSNQVSWPSKVGFTFETFDDLLHTMNMIDKAMLMELHHRNIVSYIEKRNINILENQLINIFK